MQSVSIGIPSYNGEKYIADAIKSAVNQTYKVDEIFVVDDASTDNTEEIVKGLANKIKSHKIRFIKNNKNAGYQVNWNNCFENCQTKYLIILHQDDELKEFSVEKLLKFFDDNPEIGIVGGKEDTIDSEANIIRKKHEEHALIFQKGNVYEFISTNGTYIPCSSVMFDMHKIIRVGKFDTDVLATDELFWTKVLSKYPIAILGYSVIFRRNHPDQTEWIDFSKKPKEIIGAYEHFISLDRFELRKKYKGRVRNLIKTKFCSNLVSISGAVIRYNQNTRLSFWYLFQGLKIDPFLPAKSITFWKVILLATLNFLGILNPIRMLRKRYFLRKEN